MFNLLRSMFSFGHRNESDESAASGSEEATQSCKESEVKSGTDEEPLEEPSPVSVNLPLPEDLVIYILSFMSPEDLFRQCSYVEEWKPLIGSQSLWSLKCEREGKVMPKLRPSPLPSNFYQDIYFARFGENLLKNPCGEHNLSHWSEITEGQERFYRGRDSSGWVVENPPEGANEVPDTSCQFCFATTHYWCRKGQVIDLRKEGFSTELLQALKPKIYVSECYCARFDCGSEYDLDVRLLDDNNEVLDSYRFYHKEDQWAGSAWSCTEHVFTEYPPSIRYIHFIHAGKDTQFWAGHYGSKMAEGKVILQFQ